MAAAALTAMFVAACATAPVSKEITRDRATAIARGQVAWQPFEIAASRGLSNGRRIWRVTLKGRLPDQPPMLFETAVVEIDASTGVVVSLSKT